MATYETTKTCHSDEVASGTTARHMIVTGTCVSNEVAYGKKPATSDICVSNEVASSKTEHVKPCMSSEVSGGSTATHRVTTGTCVSAEVADGDTFKAIPSQARFELFVATNGAAFDFSTPNETFTSLPHTTTLTLATGEHELVVRRRNKWGFTSLNIEAVTIVVDAGGSGQPPDPTAPEQVAITQNAS